MLVNLLTLLFSILLGVIILSGGIHVSSVMGVTTLFIMTLIVLFGNNRRK